MSVFKVHQHFRFEDNKEIYKVIEVTDRDITYKCLKDKKHYVRNLHSMIKEYRMGGIIFVVAGVDEITQDQPPQIVNLQHENYLAIVAVKDEKAYVNYIDVLRNKRHQVVPDEVVKLLYERVKMWADEMNITLEMY